MPDARGEMSPRLQGWLGIVGVVAAPITAVTALCYYFGYVSIRKEMAYLGIHSDAVGFTVNDYVTESAGVLFVAALSVSIAAAVAFAACLLFRRLVDKGGHASMLARVAWSTVGLGFLSLVLGSIGVWFPGATLDGQIWWIPLALALGAMLLIPGGWMVRICAEPTRPTLPLNPVERVLVVITSALLLLGLFWTTNLFAERAGEIDGVNTVARLWNMESTVILDTPDRLDLPDQLVRTSELTSADSPQGQTYRYECLRAIAVRGDRWILLPANWRPEFGYALIVTADASHRIALRSIKNAPDKVGGGANVRDHWPCPEFVTTATGDQVASQLPSPEEVKGVVAESDLAVSKEYVQQPESASVDPGCVGAVDPSFEAHDGAMGFVKRYGREMVNTPAGVRIDTSVTEFATPPQAADLMNHTAETWPLCVNTMMSLAEGDSKRQVTFGNHTDEEGIHTIAMESTEGVTTRQCSHARTAVSNVVTDVVTCASSPSAGATTLADAIRKSFPMERLDEPSGASAEK